MKDNSTVQALRRLPEQIRDRAIANYWAQYPNYEVIGTRDTSDTVAILMDSFNIETSNEGWEFWAIAFDTVLEMERINPDIFK